MNKNILIQEMSYESYVNTNVLAGTVLKVEFIYVDETSMSQVTFFINDNFLPPEGEKVCIQSINDYDGVLEKKAPKEDFVEVFLLTKIKKLEEEKE